MAKALGIIGNFTGKVGNMVGYSLKDSNNKQTQGIRVYQPVVRNPKSYAQAEQRARMAPINEFYRALKPIIDRGQEGVPYGNKSRLAWLSDAMKNFDGAWLQKGERFTFDNTETTAPILVNLTKGSLPSINATAVTEDSFNTTLRVSLTEEPTTLGGWASNLISNNPQLKEGDQLTFVMMTTTSIEIESIVLNSTSEGAISGLMIVGEAGNQVLGFDVSVVSGAYCIAAAVILSRQASTGQHLRSTAALTLDSNVALQSYWDAAAKDAAIRSYMTAGTSSDWPQEQFVDE